MKQLVVLSGKGGTGKTTVSAALAHLSASSKSMCHPVLVDADVDAANLSLILKPQIGIQNRFMGGSQAVVDEARCQNCGACVQVCRYDAILPHPEGLSSYWVDPIACDGCAACVYACPESVIKMEVQQEGIWFQSKSPYGDLFHAELFAGHENSGKLVTLIRQYARLFAEESDRELIIIDGPPGIGCPVISSCAGVDLGLIVTEPGLSGLHDMIRIYETLQHFKIPTVLCINKADLYKEGTRNILEFASNHQLEVLGEIPFDESVSKSILNEEPVTVVYPDSQASFALNKVWDGVSKHLDL